MNGHFASVGEEPTSQRYEHGVQVIDEDKAFKCVGRPSNTSHCRMMVQVIPC